jgi:TolA-binding protein
VVAIATVTIGVAAAASLRDTGRSASQPVGAKVSVVADAKERSSTATASSASAPRAPAPPPATVADVLDAPLPVRSAAPERASAFPSSAQELLTKADQLRRSGSPSSALVTYRELQRRFPSSIEAQISRMSAGRMLLTSSGDAAGALRQFDGYLAHGSGALREEALIGRATALARLGRTADERATWRQLLREYPNSQGARLARTRLDVTGANRP